MISRVFRLLDLLNDALCRVGSHQWHAGTREGTRYCAQCGAMQELDRWSVTIEGAAWREIA